MRLRPGGCLRTLTTRCAELVTVSGTGAPLADGVVRLVLATKAVSLARGHSGVRPEVIDALLALFNSGLPRIPCNGSVGASGDLAIALACGAGLLKLSGCVRAIGRQHAPFFYPTLATPPDRP